MNTKTHRTPSNKWVFGVLALAFSATAQAQAPFDPSTAPSEQLRFNGDTPKLVAVSAADSVVVGQQLFTSGKPSSAKLSAYRRSGSTYARTWEAVLPLPRLVGLTTDGASFYAASAADEDLRYEATIVSYRPNILVLSKVDAQGKSVWQRDLNSAAYFGDPSGAEAKTAVYSPLTGGTGALAFGANKLVLTLASNTTPDPALQAPMQRRHQRSQIVVVGSDGAALKTANESSWRHSFDQRLLFDGTDFVFADLGDAGWYMPGGGIALRKIKPTATGATFTSDKQGVYVYMRQSETANAQNFTFTSLGDIERGVRGYVALFTSEKSNPGATRDGNVTPVAEPRQLGLVHVTKGFDTVQDGESNGTKRLGNTIYQNQPVGVRITANVVDSPGTASTTVTRPDKTNMTFTTVGIVWLTNLPAGTSAERPKLVRLADDRYLALWEEWSYSGKNLAYVATKAAQLNEAGQIVTAPAKINARLNPSGADRPFLLDGRAAWITTNAGNLVLNTVDGTLALATSALSNTSAPATVRNQLLAGEELKPGEKIQSPDARYWLIYQSDGNLVLYAASGALWATGTNGKPPGRAIMQTDGNLCLYGPSNNFLWQSGTQFAGSKLVLQNDANLVIYKSDGRPAWASNTVRP